MRRLLLVIIVAAFVSCSSKQNSQQTIVSNDEVEVQDSTSYGVCSDINGNTLQIVTATNDTLEFVVGSDDMESATHVCGGMMKGDRMAVTAHKVDEKLWADRVINLTSLLGNWEGSTRTITFTEDGDEWRILNGELLLGKDTFSVYNLNADSLELENKEGIYLYKRANSQQKAINSQHE